MYYKVLKDGKVIDVLDHLTFVKYQQKHNIMILCDESEAQAIVSSDESNIWHLKWLFNIPVDGYDTVDLEKIDKYEYKQFQEQNISAIEKAIDEYTLSLLEGGIL